MSYDVTIPLLFCLFLILIFLGLVLASAIGFERIVACVLPSDFANNYRLCRNEMSYGAVALTPGVSVSVHYTHCKPQTQQWQ